MLRVAGEDTSVRAGESKPVPGMTHEPSAELKAAPGSTSVESKTAPGVIHESPAESRTAPGVTHEPHSNIDTKPTSHDGHRSGSTDSHGPKSAPHADAGAPSAGPQGPEHWLSDLEHRLNPEEKAKLAKITARKTPQELHDMLGDDLDTARERVRTELRREQDSDAAGVRSKERVAELRQQIADRDLMNDPEIRSVVTGKASKNPKEQLATLRDKLIAKITSAEVQHSHPGTEVLDGVKIYEKMPEANMKEWMAKNPGKQTAGFTERPDGLYLERGEMDIVVIQRQPGGKAKVIAREEIKTGRRDTDSDAWSQLDDQSGLLRDGATGKTKIRLEVNGHDITSNVDIGSDAVAHKSSRGPAGKGFDNSLDVSAGDLEALCKSLLAESAAKGSP
jgi:hypothetical protein